MSWRATSRSRTFDKTVRFDMSRYDFPSEGYRSGFFSNGVMYAACMLHSGWQRPIKQFGLFGDEWRQHIRIVFEKMRWKLTSGAVLSRMASMTSSTLRAQNDDKSHTAAWERSTEIFSVKEWCDLGNRVRVRLRSLQMATFDRSHTTSYSPSIVTTCMALYCIVCEI